MPLGTYNAKKMPALLGLISSHVRYSICIKSGPFKATTNFNFKQLFYASFESTKIVLCKPYMFHRFGP